MNLICFIIGNGQYVPNREDVILPPNVHAGFLAFEIDWQDVFGKIPIIFIKNGNIDYFKTYLSKLPNDAEILLLFHFGKDKTPESEEYGHTNVIKTFQNEYYILNDRVNFFSRGSEVSKQSDKYSKWTKYLLNEKVELNQKPHIFTKHQLLDSQLPQNISDIVSYVSSPSSSYFNFFENNIGENRLKAFLYLIFEALNEKSRNRILSLKNLKLKLLTPGYSGSHVFIVEGVKLSDKAQKTESYVVKISPQSYNLLKGIEHSDSHVDEVKRLRISHKLEEKAAINHFGYQVRLFDHINHKHFTELKTVISDIINSKKPKTESNFTLESVLEKVCDTHLRFFKQYYDGCVILIEESNNLWKNTNHRQDENNFKGLSPSIDKILNFQSRLEQLKKLQPNLFRLKFSLHIINDKEYEHIVNIAKKLLMYGDENDLIINSYPLMKSYIHGDLHTRNVLVSNGKKTVKFIDFDLVPETPNENPLKDYAKLAVYVELEMVRYMIGAGILSNVAEEEIEVEDLIKEYNNFVSTQMDKSKGEYHLKTNFKGKIKLLINGVEQIFNCANDFLLGEKRVKEEFKKFCEDKNFTPKQLLYFQFNLAKLHYYIKEATYDTPVVYKRLWCMKAALLLMEAVQKFDRDILKD